MAATRLCLYVQQSLDIKIGPDSYGSNKPKVELLSTGPQGEQTEIVIFVASREDITIRETKMVPVETFIQEPEIEEA